MRPPPPKHASKYGVIKLRFRKRSRTLTYEQKGGYQSTADCNGVSCTEAMEFTDKLNLQPITRPVPEPKAGEILIQVYATGGTPTEKLWYTTSHYADGSTTIQGDPRARILRHRCRVTNPS